MVIRPLTRPLREYRQRYKGGKNHFRKNLYNFLDTGKVSKKNLFNGGLKMKAGELLDEYIKRDKRGDIGVIAISQTKEMFWYHVHENEELPLKDFDIAIHIRTEKEDKK